MLRSPLTLGAFFVLAGYYLYYYGWVLWKSKHLEAADTETVSPTAAQ
jgi:threonine/homoserine/homoserine lactone efflux protein